ncbi:MAG TPA: ferredoxin [Burkholderiales bacterium]|nr:ferredoxin [Burkholderiales bacterium]
MYVILTSKPGQFRTEITADLKPVERYDYLFCGRKRAEFVIAEMEEGARVRIVDESGPVNIVPSKFLPRFGSLEEARAELKQLVSFGSIDIELVKLRPEAMPP